MGVQAWPVRPALRYHGSKWLMAPWIISHLPVEHGVYVEPFCGALAVLLRKRRSALEVANDLDGEVVNFFAMLRNRTDELIEAIRLTPYARAEMELAMEPAEDDLERARRFYVKAYQTQSGPTGRWRSGWRISTKSHVAPSMTFANVEHLYEVAERLRGVAFECAAAAEVIKRYDSADTLFYLDPPYVSETRGRWKGHAYAHEMSTDDHLALAAQLHEVKGMAVLSGYRCDLYDEQFADWHRVDYTARTDRGYAVESLWLNDAAVARGRQKRLGLVWGDNEH